MFVGLGFLRKFIFNSKFLLFKKDHEEYIIARKKGYILYICILHYDTDYLYKRPLNYPLMTSFHTGPTHHRSMINIFDFTRFCSYKA